MSEEVPKREFIVQERSLCKRVYCQSTFGMRECSLYKKDPRPRGSFKQKLYVQEGLLQEGVVCKSAFRYAVIERSWA